MRSRSPDRKDRSVARKPVGERPPVEPPARTLRRRGWRDQCLDAVRGRTARDTASRISSRRT